MIARVFLTHEYYVNKFNVKKICSRVLSRASREEREEKGREC